MITREVQRNETDFKARTLDYGINLHLTVITLEVIL